MARRDQKQVGGVSGSLHSEPLLLGQDKLHQGAKAAPSQLLPVIGHEEPEVTNVGGIFGEDDVTGELARGEPEGEVGGFTELELGMDPVGNRVC